MPWTVKVDVLGAELEKSSFSDSYSEPFFQPLFKTKLAAQPCAASL
jgi:hypothetical protein